MQYERHLKWRKEKAYSSVCHSLSWCHLTLLPFNLPTTISPWWHTTYAQSIVSMSSEALQVNDFSNIFGAFHEFDIWVKSLFHRWPKEFQCCLWNVIPCKKKKMFTVTIDKDKLGCLVSKIQEKKYPFWIFFYALHSDLRISDWTVYILVFFPKAIPLRWLSMTAN